MGRNKSGDGSHEHKQKQGLYISTHIISHIRNAYGHISYARQGHQGKQDGVRNDFVCEHERECVRGERESNIEKEAEKNRKRE